MEKNQISQQNKRQLIQCRRWSEFSARN